MILALDVDVQLYYSNAALRAHPSSLGLAEANKGRQRRTSDLHPHDKRWSQFQQGRQSGSYAAIVLHGQKKATGRFLSTVIA
jgi:hypothetical protein